MKSKLYIFLIYRKSVKSTSNLTKYVNTCKNLITFLSCSYLNTTLILEYNITSHLNFSSNNNKENIGPKASNNGEKNIKPVDINNNKKNIRLVNIDKQRPATSN